MANPRATAAATILWLGCLATPALADVTGFLGVNTTPANRPVVGGAFSVSLLVIGFEGEYSQTTTDQTSGSPSLQTGMGNVFVQNPIPVGGIQVYVTAGGGIYREELGIEKTTDVGTNFGGGAKIELVSHIKLRVDYRVFKLAGSAKYATPKRLYLGLTLGL